MQISRKRRQRGAEIPQSGQKAQSVLQIREELSAGTQLYICICVCLSVCVVGATNKQLLPAYADRQNS